MPGTRSVTVLTTHPTGRGRRRPWCRWPAGPRRPALPALPAPGWPRWHVAWRGAGSRPSVTWTGASLRCSHRHDPCCRCPGPVLQAAPDWRSGTCGAVAGTRCGCSPRSSRGWPPRSPPTSYSCTRWTCRSPASWRPLGRDLFWWLTRLGVLTRTADSRLARRLRKKGDLVIGTRWLPWLHTRGSALPGSSRTTPRGSPHISGTARQSRWPGPNLCCPPVARRDSNRTAVAATLSTSRGQDGPHSTGTRENHMINNIPRTFAGTPRSASRA
jgi:hypothetical protein